MAERSSDDENVRKLIETTTATLQEARKLRCDVSLIDEAIESLTSIRCDRESLCEVIRVVELCSSSLRNGLSELESEIVDVKAVMSEQKRKIDAQNGVIDALRSRGDPKDQVAKSYDLELAHMEANVVLANSRAEKSSKEEKRLRGELQAKERERGKQADVIRRQDGEIDRLKKKVANQKSQIKSHLQQRDESIDRQIETKLAKTLEQIAKEREEFKLELEEKFSEKLVSQKEEMKKELEEEFNEKLASQKEKFNEKLASQKEELASQKEELASMSARLNALEFDRQLVIASQIITSFEEKLQRSVLPEKKGLLLKNFTREYDEKKKPLTKQEYELAVANWKKLSCSTKWDSSYGEIFSTIVKKRNRVSLPSAADSGKLNFALIRSKAAPEKTEDDFKNAFKWISSAVLEL
ncbi:uncharacterized protein [Oscarella lobularis]|uniref:uncharacterized protein n=1 Tax=Oscarella lobularis TaxID=121494 RepID=UPI003314378F